MLSHFSRLFIFANMSSSKSLNRLRCIANHCTSTGYSPMNLSENALAKGSTCPPITPGVMRLYNMRFCPFAQRTRLVLEHKKIPYEIVNVNLKHKPDWFFKLNPQGLVPILEKDGKVIYESTATCEWLDDVYPENKLQSLDPDRKAADRMLLEYFVQFSTDIIHRILRRPEQREVLLKRVKKHYQFYEGELARRGGPYFGGSRVAMIDFFLWPHLERVPAMSTIVPQLEITSSEYPHMANWFQHMYERPEVKATIMSKESHLHFLVSLASGNPDYDYGLSG